MIRLIGLGLLTFGLVALLQAAQEPAPEKPEPPVRLKKKDKAAPEPAPEKPEPPVRLKKKDKADGAPKPAEEGPDEQTKELLARVAKNMETSEDRLKNQDPSDKTRKIQDQIVKDLDELIKKAQQQQQQQDQQASSGSSGGGSSGKSGSAQRKSKASKSQGSQQAKDSGARPKPGEGQEKKGGKDKNDQAKGAAGKKDSKDSKDKQAKEGSASKDGGGGNSAQKRNTIADVLRTEKDIWGHLPEAKRQEMDAYARDRFMPKYDELLRQYYRTISEQNRKKDAD